ncbi:MAG: hypothetical protein KKH74_13345 [Gammaproteobacteria bacterium]|nr:hypothetical protein [Gammaproteobacteria bacterium]MBU1732769.1 hypothetical protein [Gammaproteobacteria bacterium]MBU1891594.1 hypothetical protein [Gammaproteobacteria bacterium]
MATVNFSVPEEVKQAFNTVFEGQNKSAVITSLMKRAIEEQELQEKRAQAMNSLLARRKHKPAFSAEEICAAREDGRT